PRLQILELRNVRMRHKDLRVPLEARSNGDRRDILRNRIERLQRIGAHEEIDLPDWKQDAVVHVRAAGHDRDIKPVSPVGTVGERLVKAAMLGFRDPVGAEANLVERLRRSGRREHDGAHDTRNHGEPHAPPPWLASASHNVRIRLPQIAHRCAKLDSSFGGHKWIQTSKPKAMTSASTILSRSPLWSCRCSWRSRR